MMRARTLQNRRLLLAAILALSFAVAAHVFLLEKYRTNQSMLTPMLYLPSGKYLKAISFGYHALLADFIYLWSIQYYGDPNFHPQVEYLKHTYDIITELDPHYIDAYQMGALFMFHEGKNPEAGLRLLDQGLEKNPDEWVFPTTAGFYCMISLKDNRRSIAYFQKASQLKGAPSLVKRMQAGLHFRMGDKRVAYNLWREVYETTTRATIKQVAYQNMHDARVLIDLEDLRKAIGRYREIYNKNPLNLHQLTATSILTKVPADPEGNEYVYNPEKGTVEYSGQLTVFRRFQ